MKRGIYLFITGMVIIFLVSIPKILRKEKRRICEKHKEPVTIKYAALCVIWKNDGTTTCSNLLLRQSTYK